MPPGSYLAVAHFAKDLYQDQMARFARVLNENLRVGRKPDRVRIPFARDPAFELNTR